MPHHVPAVGLVGVVLGISRVAHTNLGDALLYLLAALSGCRPGLVIVVDDVDVLSLTAIAAIAAPVVEHVIANVDALVFLCCSSRPQSRTA